MNIVTNILRPRDICAELRPDNTTTLIDTGSFALYGLRIEPVASVNGSPVVIRPASQALYSGTFSSRVFNGEFGAKGCEEMRRFAAIAASKADVNLSGSYENVYRFKLLRTDPDSTSVTVDSEELNAGWFWPLIMTMARGSSVSGNVFYEEFRAFSSYTDRENLLSGINMYGSIREQSISNAFGDISDAQSLDIYVPLYGADDSEFSVRIYNSESGESEVLPWKFGSEGYQGTVTFGSILGLGGTCGATMSSKWGSDSKWSSWKSVMGSAGGSLTGKKYDWYRYSKTFLNSLGFGKAGATMIMNGYTSDSDGVIEPVDALEDAVTKLGYREISVPSIKVQAGFIAGPARNWSKTPSNQWRSVSNSAGAHNNILALPAGGIFRMDGGGYSGIDLSECGLDPYFYEDTEFERASQSYRYNSPVAGGTLSGSTFGLSLSSDPGLYGVLSPASSRFAGLGYIRMPDDMSTELTYSVSVGIKMTDKYRKYAPYRTEAVDYNALGRNKFAKDASVSGCMPDPESTPRFNGVMPQIIAGIVGLTTESATATELGAAMLADNPVADGFIRYCRYCHIGAGSDSKGTGAWIGDNMAAYSFEFAESLAGSYDFPVSGANGTWFSLTSDTPQTWSTGSRNKVYFVVMQRASSDTLQQTARWRFTMASTSGSSFNFPDANAENQIKRIGNCMSGNVEYVLYAVRYTEALQSTNYVVTRIFRFQPEVATEYKGMFYVNRSDLNLNDLYTELTTSSGQITTPEYPTLSGIYSNYRYASKWVLHNSNNVSYGPGIQLTLTKDTSYVLTLLKNLEATHVVYLMAAGGLEASSSTGGQWVTGGLAGSSNAGSLLKIAYYSNGAWVDAVSNWTGTWLSQRDAYGTTYPQNDNPEYLFDAKNGTGTQDWYVPVNLGYDKEYAILYRKSFTSGGKTYQITAEGTTVPFNSMSYILAAKFRVDTTGVTVTGGSGWEASASALIQHGPNPGGRWLLRETSPASSPGIVYREFTGQADDSPNEGAYVDGPGLVMISDDNKWGLYIVKTGQMVWGPDGLTVSVTGLAIVWMRSGEPPYSKVSLRNIFIGHDQLHAPDDTHAHSWSSFNASEDYSLFSIEKEYLTSAPSKITMSPTNTGGLSPGTYYGWMIVPPSPGNTHVKKTLTASGGLLKTTLTVTH